MAENRYLAGYAKLGTSSCKKCKQKIDKGALRIAKLVSNPFSEDAGDMKQWFHPPCIFETFVRARATTKKIEDPDDVEGFSDLQQDDKDKILGLIKDLLAKAGSPSKKKTPSKPKSTPAKKSNPVAHQDPGPSAKPDNPPPSNDSSSNGSSVLQSGKDDSFREFRRLCADIAEENSYTGKTAIIFHTSQKAMLEDLEQGDVAETVKMFFEKSTALPPQKKCTLTLQEVDKYLGELSTMTKEDDQEKVLRQIAKQLDALDPNAYAAFQASRDLRDVVERVVENRGDKPGLGKKLSVRASLMTPVLPMLIKYDGERVQLHKKGSEFQYFSRSLKPVLPHKVSHFKEFIPKAFQSGDDLILDAEVLLIDTNTGNPLPFGSLGKHKDANVCLFVFDCLHLNGENIMDKPIKERRKILAKEMVEIPNRIMFSEMKHITKDYLNEGSMADSADLTVLGAFYGRGMMSVFLMGVYDPANEKWCTVTKVGNGFDDATLDKLQTELDMVKISKKPEKVPAWLDVKKNVIPDFVVADPKAAPIWEISGAEFSKAEVHTADGISIRFPRVTKVLFKKSKETSDIVIPGTKGKGKAGTPVKRLQSTDSDNASHTPSKANPIAAPGGITKYFSPKKEPGPGADCAGVCVSVDWLWKCIKTKTLQPTEAYVIRKIKKKPEKPDAACFSFKS
ncbi:DNLI3-like protein [Mya arenaria]|uniref:DNLI3-like protein n=1 Tax=Mya arenaria TaxID=6604 RepID=A0ABY7EZP3_MYAAR|nr:DNLI3-like protein [Mya arenaria]